MQIHVQGNQTSVDTYILPVFHKLRFQFGIVPSSQLAVVSKKALRVRETSSLDPHQILRAWLICRLAAGVEPNKLVSELLAAKATNGPCKELILRVLEEFGLHERSGNIDYLSAFASSDRSYPSSLGTSASITSASTTSLSSTLKNRIASLNPKSPNRRTASDDPERWYHRRNKSSFSRLFNTERRPSLPIISSPSLVMSTAFDTWSPETMARRDPIDVCPFSTPRRSTHASLKELGPADLLSTMMTFSSGEDMRVILLDRLLAMRYHLTKRSEDDWFLGKGKSLASEVIDKIEAKLVRSKDVMGLKAIFSDLRRIFRLPEPGPLVSPYRRVSRQFMEKLPTVPLRESISPISFRERDASFDLNQYIADISFDHLRVIGEDCENEPQKRKSLSADSIFTMLTSDTGRTSRTARRASMISSFTIREATREWHAPTQAVAWQIPGKVKSLESFYHERSDEHDLEINHFHRDEHPSSTLDQDQLEAPFARLRPKDFSLPRLERHSAMSTTLSGYDLDLDRRSSFALCNPPPGTYHILEAPFQTPAQLNVQILDLPLSPPPTEKFTPRATMTDDDRSRRRAYRQFAIFDGEQFSPSEESLMSSGSETPRVPPRLSSLNHLPKAKLSGQAPLAHIMSLFTTSSGQIRPTSGLTNDDVVQAVSSMVESEISRLESQGRPWDDDAKGRVAWSIEQVGQMVCFRGLRIRICL